MKRRFLVFFTILCTVLLFWAIFGAKNEPNTQPNEVNGYIPAPEITNLPDRSGSVYDSSKDQPQIDYTKAVLLNVPFTSQAPQGQWSDERFQDGCEEASVIMAMSWVNGSSLNPESAQKQIIDLSAYEDLKFSGYPDLSSKDVLSLIKDYYGYDQVELKSNIDTEMIAEELYKGNIVLAPLDGQKLGNPNFTNGGPERHMAVIIGYDPKTNEFIFNDPGTRKGAGYRYSREVVSKSLRTYQTGRHAPILPEEKTMIVVYPKKS
jgi:hypothetical protein